MLRSVRVNFNSYIVLVDDVAASLPNGCQHSLHTSIRRTCIRRPTRLQWSCNGVLKWQQQWQCNYYRFTWIVVGRAMLERQYDLQMTIKG